jgi:hypothetical protein
MPPLSYVITAIVLGLIFFGSPVYPFYWLFATTAGVLTIAGVIRIARALRAPLWIGPTLAIPGIFWTAHTLYDVYTKPRLLETVVVGLVGIIANLAAGVGALRLLEMTGLPRKVFWIGCTILGTAALCTTISLIALFPGYGLTVNLRFAFYSPYYTIIGRPLTLLGAILSYISYVGFVIVISRRRHIEIWISAVVTAVGIYLIYKVVKLMLWIPIEGQHDGLIAWPEPVIMFIGGVAVWRLGSVLSAQATTATAPYPGLGPRAVQTSIQVTAPPQTVVRQSSQPILQSGTVSEETIPPNRSRDRAPMSRGVMIYFGVLAVLTLGTVVQSSTIVGILLHILLGPILSVPPTLLYYSTALLPAYFVGRLLHREYLAGALALVCLTLAAALPHYIGEYSLYRLVAADHTDPPASISPRSFELPYPERDNYWMNWRQTESHDITPPPPCADLCQQLLFKGHIDHVIIRDYNSRNAPFTNRETFERGSDGSMHRTVHVTWLPRWRRFHLERRDSCPDTLSLIAPEFVHEVVGGHRLIEDTSDRREADVLVSLSKPLDVRGADGQLRPDLNIAFANVESDPTTITIAEQRDGKVIPVEIRTALHASYLTVPFLFHDGTM